MDRIPNEIIIHYDKRSKKCLIRLVDKDYNDMAVYNTLPPLFSIFGSCVAVHPVFSYVKGDGFYEINDKILFYAEDDKNITIFSDGKDYDYELGINVVNYLESLFGVSE